MPLSKPTQLSNGRESEQNDLLAEISLADQPTTAQKQQKVPIQWQRDEFVVVNSLPVESDAPPPQHPDILSSRFANQNVERMSTTLL